MKVLQINAVYKNGGSTGRIVYDLMNVSNEKGIDAYVAFGYEYVKTNDKKTYKAQSIPELKYSILQTRLFGLHGFYNKRSTKKMLKWIDDVKPDIIHLHNLHCHYMNVELLFNYIKEKNIPVVWTFHDCWPFTGWCAHFDYAGCEKWKSHCGNCQLKHSYPFTWFFDRSYTLYERKRELFTGVNNLTIVTPSEWLSKLVKQSFLGSYSVRVINNGIDLNVFKPSPNDFRIIHNIENKKMVLAIANGFTINKGIDIILKLPNLLSDDYAVVVVGAAKDQVKDFSGIVINYTNDVAELASIYSAADVFVNPTLEDTFPTTNIEALACGTPVVTFASGGSPEIIDEKTGIVVEKNDRDGFIEAIINISKTEIVSKDCRNRAIELYDKREKYNDYINLYQSII